MTNTDTITISEDNTSVFTGSITIDRNIVSAFFDFSFDADKKFGTNTKDNEDDWVNLYAEYDVANKTLRVLYFFDHPVEYKPTDSERKTFINLLTKYVIDCTDFTSLEEYVEYFNR